MRSRCVHLQMCATFLFYEFVRHLNLVFFVVDMIVPFVFRLLSDFLFPSLYLTCTLLSSSFVKFLC